MQSMPRMPFLRFVTETCKNITFCLNWLFSLPFYFFDTDASTVCSTILNMLSILVRKHFFVCSLTAAWLALGHYQEGSLNQPMLIGACFLILTQRSIFIISLETIKFSGDLIWRGILKSTPAKTKDF